ncbi:MAG: TIGR03936 family radical SAM-associated protein [Candidatus Omnitrophica bacterium]|nr:TIGR03936 family radical SAM-associated protein [Candidatus Omnitrophota bacterium]
MSESMKVVFSKSGDMRFISHLDLVRMFQRASRRAEIPVTVTKGFSPHLKISIQKALKLGVESMSEEAVFYLDEKVTPDEFVRKMNSNLPEGVKIVKAEYS